MYIYICLKSDRNHMAYGGDVEGMRALVWSLDRGGSVKQI
jgi:hypothetical protein